MGLLYALSIGAAFILFRVWARAENRYCPDAAAYIAMSQGVRVPVPYCLRWLYPFIMPKRASLVAWMNTGAVGLWLTFPLIYLFATASGVNGLWACALWGTLPLIDILWGLPGLVDHVSWPVGIATAVLFLNGHTEAAIALSLIGGLIEPRLPVMVAAWAWNPWALVGLVSVAVLWKVAKRGPAEIMEDPEPLLHPWQAGQKYNTVTFRDMRQGVLPWGALLAGLAALTPAVVASLALAYSQLFRATDRARLFMWAAPVMLVAAMRVIPETMLPVAVLVTWYNPWRGEA